MEYDPGDPQKITDTVIALDIAMTALIQASRRVPELRDEFEQAFAHAVQQYERDLPKEMRGVIDMLTDWKGMLTTWPSDPAEQ